MTRGTNLFLPEGGGKIKNDTFLLKGHSQEKQFLATLFLKKALFTKLPFGNRHRFLGKKFSDF